MNVGTRLLPISIVLVSLLLTGVFACSDSDEKGSSRTKEANVEPAAAVEGPALFAYENTPENLEALMRELNRPVPMLESDLRRIAELTRSLFPDEALFNATFKPSALEPKITRRLALYQRLPKGNEVAGVFRPKDPERTEIRVYTAKVSEIPEAVDADPARAGKFQGVAPPKYLRPDLTVHQVEITKPGESDGVMYHLFVWHDGRWRTLGPFWSQSRMSAFLNLPDPLLRPPSERQ